MAESTEVQEEFTENNEALQHRKKLDDCTKYCFIDFWPGRVDVNKTFTDVVYEQFRYFWFKLRPKVLSYCHPCV